MAVGAHQAGGVPVGRVRHPIEAGEFLRQPHLGSQTVWDLPISLRLLSSLRGRCLPHKKQDMVEGPVLDAVMKGEPPTLDL